MDGLIVLVLVFLFFAGLGGSSGPRSFHVMHPKMERRLNAINKDPICRRSFMEAMKNLDEEIEFLEPVKTYKDWFHRLIGKSNGIRRRKMFLKRA